MIATSTGTAALHLALNCLDIGPGDEVIVPSLTFVGSYQAIAATGATPVSCDVCESTLLTDVADVERRITSRTRAIMPVHYGGSPCNMDRLLELKNRYDVRIVEDAAHAFGTTYHGKKIGSIGDVTCFSFDSIKNITCGEGGAIASGDQELLGRLRTRRQLGIDRRSEAVSSWKNRSWQFTVRSAGFRYHMSAINAAIGKVQLSKVRGFIARRREICRAYDVALGAVSGIRLREADYDTVAPHIYVIRVEGGRRDALKRFLQDRDIETGINYVPNHLHEFFAVDNCRLPVTEKVFEELLTLPLHCGLSSDDVEAVIDAVVSFMDV